MNLALSTRATALGLAALVTFTLMGSIEQIATSPAPAPQIARIEGPASAPQVIEITGKRLGHG